MSRRATREAHGQGIKPSPLRAPFPWFGGKSRCSALVWARLGDVSNYLEPFFGSGAILLSRPTVPRTETVNDLDCYLANFWRSCAAAPSQLAHYADYPVSEIDLHSRHAWLVDQSSDLRAKLKANHKYFDAKIAGYWLWGICQWIGISGWCNGRPANSRPALGNPGMGVHRPHLGRSVGLADGAPQRQAILEIMRRLQERLRHVRVCCGDWRRVLTVLPPYWPGATGVFLDPPYSKAAGRASNLYAQDSLDVAVEVRKWALENGNNPGIRIALCGYEGEHEMPENWECVAWKPASGYNSIGDGGAGTENRKKERIWFSPHCLKIDLQIGQEQPLLFGSAE